MDLMGLYPSPNTFRSALDQVGRVAYTVSGLFVVAISGCASTKPDPRTLRPTLPPTARLPRRIRVQDRVLLPEHILAVADDLDVLSGRVVCAPCPGRQPLPRLHEVSDLSLPSGDIPANIGSEEICAPMFWYWLSRFWSSRCSGVP